MAEEKSCIKERLLSGSTEILRVSRTLSFPEELPGDISDFYSELSVRAINAAKKLLFPIAEEKFKSFGGKKGFFRKYNYSFSCNILKETPENAEAKMEIDVSCGSESLLHRELSQTWDIKNKIMVRKKKKLSKK